MPLTIFDRYVTRLFVRVMVVCFLSTTGLYCLIDAFNNMDELVGLGKELGGLPKVMADYYGARVPWFFDRASALMTLIAALFSVNALQRTNELTAMMAAGVHPGRVIRPLIVAACLTTVMAAANREVVLPPLRDRLVRNAQDWMGKKAQPVQPTIDNQTEILLNGKSVLMADRRIEQPSFQLYQRYGGFGRFLRAANAFYHEATDRHPSGYLLDGVTEPADLDALASVVVENTPVILTPRDQPWLEAGQLFVVSDVNFDQLAGGNAWRRFASTPEILRDLHNPSLDFGLDVRVMLHSRIVQPFLDMTLFFLVLPLVFTRDQRNVFVAIGWCFLIVIVYFVVQMGCQAMGNSGYLVSPSLAAWIPLFIFAPLATFSSHSLWGR